MLKTPSPRKTPRRRASRQELQELLRQRSTTIERVTGLQEILSVSLIAHATDVSISTVRNWGAGQGEPRQSAALALDDLRAVAKTLLDGEMEPDEVAGWLISRNPTTGERPIDEISQRPTEVLADATSEVLVELVHAREPEHAGTC